MPEPLTTAARLGRFYAELVDADLPVDVAVDIVRHAAAVEIDADGFEVKA